MNTPRILIATVTLAAAALTGCSTFSNTKPSLTVDQVMDEGFKGKGSMASRLGENTATDADKQRMVYLTQQLTLNQAPKGDTGSWEEKTAKLNRAAIALADKLPDSLELWRAASDCKACHSLHKPD